MTAVQDMGWVQEIVTRKGAAGENDRPADADASSLAFSVLRTELWREFIAAVGAYNSAVGREEVIIALQAEGRIGIGKDGFPSGYLEILPDRGTGRVTASFRMQKSAAAPLRLHVMESACEVRGGVAYIRWGGRDLSVQEEVRRILTAFFEEI